MKQTITTTIRIITILFFINSVPMIHCDETADDMKAVSSVLKEVLNDSAYNYVDRVPEEKSSPVSFSWLNKIARLLSIPAFSIVLLISVLLIGGALFFLIRKVSIEKRVQITTEDEISIHDEPSRLLAESFRLINNDELRNGVLLSVKALICYYGKIKLLELKNGTTFREYCRTLRSDDEKSFFKSLILSAEKIVFSADNPEKQECLLVYEEIKKRIS